MSAVSGELCYNRIPFKVGVPWAAGICLAADFTQYCLY